MLEKLDTLQLLYNVTIFFPQKNYESVISQYKKKLEDAQELRKKVKAMEDKNMMYMQQNMDLEEVGVAMVM